MAEPDPDPIVKCVPNFSEGSDEGTLDAITKAIESIHRCQILDIAIGGKDTNRTIYTFIGPKNNVVQAALCAAKVAYQRIDMQKQKGEHPRIGALDVCPFVPLRGVSIDECVELAKEFGEKLAAEFHVPVYFYECAQKQEHRKTIRQIREMEYEGLQEKLKDPDWKPDCGPTKFDPTWGATITGARKQLITFNVNVLGTKEQALKIARKVRGEGSGPDEPGLFKTVKATAWYLAEHDVSQVCMSLTEYKETPLHEVFQACCDEAKSLNVAIVGSEIHGLVPLEAMLTAAKAYSKESGVIVLQKRQMIRLAVDRLRLTSISEFKPNEKILEYRMKSDEDGPMLSSSVRQFVESIAYGRLTPGVGSAATCIASMGVALGTMVGLMSGDVSDKMREAIEPLHSALQKLMSLIDEDTAAVEVYLQSQELQQEDQTSFAQENTKSLKGICDIPLKVMETALNCWSHMETIADSGSLVIGVNVVQVGAQSLDLAIQLAGTIIQGNLTKISDTEYCAEKTREVQKMTEESKCSLEKVLKKCTKSTK